MPSDDLVKSTRISPPTLGLVEGIEPSLPDDQMPPAAAAELRNIRVYNGLWQTRLGSALYKAIGGSGAARWLFTHYASNGGRFRLAARGNTTAAILYDLEEGVDAAFQTTTGGTGLGGATHQRFIGVTQNNRTYFLDREGPLRRYEPAPSSGNQVRPVALPVKPAVAPNVKARWFDILENWSSLAGYTHSNAADFEITSSSATPPDGGQAVNISIKTTNAQGDTITENVTGEDIFSNTIAYWQRADTRRDQITLEIGVGQAAEYPLMAMVPELDLWYPVFFAVGNLAEINFKRFRCVRDPFAVRVYTLGPIYLPGRLNGEYRWIYTHYDSTTGRESAPSPIGNGGTPLDLSTIGITNDIKTQRAMNKSALLTFTSDSGADATTNQVRFYRNGGVPDLTKDSRGQDVWFLVGTVNDVSTTLDGGVSAGATTIVVTSATGLAIGDTLILEKNTVNKEEFVRITNIVGTTLTLKLPLNYAHNTGEDVQMAFHDNVSNAFVDVLHPVDLVRDDPPSGARWIARSPDGRLWLANTASKPTGIFVSNRATPERPEDYEVFPQSVDPIVRRNLLQGWSFELGGDVTDEEIVWFGLFQGFMHALTRRNLYRIAAYSQLDFSPTAIVKVASVGCIAGDTVAEVNGVLMWVAEGPRVMAWDGTSAPRDMSERKVNVRLPAAAASTWANWFAVYHARKDGHYYCLFFTPSGASGDTQRLDYNADGDQWEPTNYNVSIGVLRVWQAATVFDSAADPHTLYQADDAGNIYQMETGSDDAGVAITITFRTKRFGMGGYAGLVKELFARLDGVTDTVAFQVRTGGAGDYAQVTHSYSLSTAGTGDIYLRTKVERDLQGRWFEVEASGNVSNRPAFKEMEVYWVPIRPRRMSGG